MAPLTANALALLLATALLAGCAQEPAAGAEGLDGVVADPQAFRDVDLQYDATHGAILGIVVDATISPIQGATVTLKDGEGRNATTDAQGRFTFGRVAPGTHFVEVSHPDHLATQASVEVIANVEPEIVKVRLEPRFTAKAYTSQVKYTGFFQCSQAGASAFYSSSNCVDGVGGGNTPDEASNLTQQTREWHADVEAGWQRMVFEMVWTPTSQGTSERMGLVVSTYKPTREGNHQFANVASGSPMRVELKVGEDHETAGTVDPTQVPPEGMKDMSFFVAVRPPADAACVLLCVPPGIAINQDFEIFLTQFYNGLPPEGWSVVNGDKLPF